VRDAHPTEEALLAWLGVDAGRYHVLRKSGLVQLEGGHVELSRRHLSPDGRSFRLDNRLFLIDEDREVIL
jgi:hypothetical protein